MRRTVREDDRDRGAVAVEFALVFPVLILMLFGIVEFGVMYNAQMLVTAAAREGARSMAIDNSVTTARAVAVAASPTVTILPTEVSFSTTTCSAGTTVRVTVKHAQPFLTGLFGATLTLTGQATRRCDG